MRMHTKLAAVAVVCALALAITGCPASTPTDIAVRTVGMTVTSVDLAMKVWGPYARDGKATPAQEQTVRDAYAKYQTVLRTAQVAMHVSNNTATPAELAAAAADLINLIQSITGKPVAFLNGLIGASHVV
jgi:hypothetical protein